MHLLFSESALKPPVRVSQQQQRKSAPVMSILSRPQPTSPSCYAPQVGFNHSARKNKTKNKTLSFRKSSRTGVHSTSRQAGTDIRPQRAGWRRHNLPPCCTSPSELHCVAGRAARMVCDCHKVITNDLLSGLTLSISEREMIYGLTGILLGFIRLSRRFRNRQLRRRGPAS